MVLHINVAFILSHTSLSDTYLLIIGYFLIIFCDSMNPIIQLLKDQNVSDEKTKEVFQSLTENPLMAMNTIAELGLPPEKLQAVMMQVMTNPDLIKEAVEELGLDFSAVEKAKQQLDQR